MTVNPNPKKSRPYDQPPKRRRSLIPGGPDSAATGFMVLAILWLAASLGIAALAVFIRIAPFTLSFPFGILDLGFELDARRVNAAFMNAVIYGFVSNAGFAAIAFMTPRLIGRPLAYERLVNVGLAMWNLALAGGIAALYVFDLGPNSALTAMPWLFMGGLAAGALIVTGSFLLTVASSITGAYISIWFAAIALLGLLGLTGLAATVGLADFFLEIPELAVALVSVFVERAVLAIWMLGMAYAILHYLVPRAAAQPLASSGLAILTWLTWLAFAPASALATLTDPAIPFVITTIGDVATMLLILPAALAIVNLAQTMQGRWSLLLGVGPAAFAAVSLAFLLGVAVLEAIGALGSVQALVGGTEWDRGVFSWAAYGAFGLAALGFGEHALPRLMRRSWGGGFLAGAQLWLVFGGVTIAGTALMFCGLAEGSFRAQGVPAEEAAAGLAPYLFVAFGGIAIAALGALASLVNLFRAYTSAAPAEYIVPGQSAPAAAGH
jgi:cytochrome c oxidase cbb3-type subunit 1